MLVDQAAVVDGTTGELVVGVVLAAETARKEEAGAGGLLFTMIDDKVRKNTLRAPCSQLKFRDSFTYADFGGTICIGIAAP